MGDVADAMLDGTLCEGCGGFVGEPVGYPRRCDACSGEDKRRRELKRNTTVVNAKEVLQANSIEFTEHNEGLHLRVKCGVKWLDFWPSTGRWRSMEGTTNFGIHPFIRYIKRFRSGQ